MKLKKYLYDNFIMILFSIAGLLVMGITIYTSIFIFSFSTYVIFILTAVVIFIGILSFTINKRKQAAFLAHARQQELMSELSLSFITAKEATSLITGALRKTGEFLDADRVFIGIADMNSEISHAVYVWARSGEAVTPNVKGLSDLIGTAFPHEQPESIPTICCDNEIGRAHV